MTRTTLTLLFTVSTLLAQPISILPNLSRLLGLTEAQQQQWDQIQTAWQQYQTTKFERLTVVNGEIRLERQRTSPSPTELGLRYYEIAAICQEGLSRRTEQVAALTHALTPDQRVILQALQSRTLDLAHFGEARYLNLVDTDIPNAINPFAPNPSGWVSNRTDSRPTVVGCSDNTIVGAILRAPEPPSNPFLNRYLGFNTEQLQKVQILLQQRELESRDLNFEAQTLLEQLRNSATEPNPQPEVLGAKSVRLEQICREVLVIYRAYTTAFEQLLATDAQKQRWQDIQKAIELLPTIQSAQFIDTLPQTFTDSDRPTQWRVASSTQSNIPACNIPGQSPGFALGGVFIGAANNP